MIGHKARTLTDEEVNKLQHDYELVSDYKQRKLESDARKHWDLFYKRNETRFFKDRHWTKREFEELIGTVSCGNVEKPVLLEVGCGVGNFIFPLIEENTKFFILACDFSPRAIEFVKENPLLTADKGRAFVCDVTSESHLLENVTENSVDVVSMVFVLSAIHPEKHIVVLKNLYSVLKKDGVVLFRDYGLYDQAQLRFGRGHKLAENFYVRQDGTRAYYFSEEKIAELFHDAGFQQLTNNYVKRETVNKKEGICVPRIFVQSKFIKR